jgi:hypothetical protein
MMLKKKWSLDGTLRLPVPVPEFGAQTFLDRKIKKPLQWRHLLDPLHLKDQVKGLSLGLFA